MEKLKLFINDTYLNDFDNYLKWITSEPINLFMVIIDILIVLYLIKKAYQIVKDTNAIQVVKGIAILILFTMISGWLKLYILNFILKTIMTYIVLLVLIVFQPELRRTLSNIGNKGIGKLFKIEKKQTLNNNIIDNILDACEHLSKKYIGGLIVIESNDKLGDYMRTGIKIDANLSKELIINLFEPNTPLHDGAIIIEGEKIRAAACILPLTKRTDLKSEFGTRHRAGIGISEVADCIVIIVSEETGKMSLCMNGKISTNLTREQLDKFLKRELKKEIIE